MEKHIAIVLAGGVGCRMRTKAIPKQFLELHGKPIIIHTLNWFEKCPEVDAIIISCKEEWMDYLKDLLVHYHISKVSKVIPGGETRQLSIYHGLCTANEIAGGRPAIVLIHDSVRPILSEDLLSRDIRCVKEHGSAITVGICKETSVQAIDGKIEQVLPRSESRVAKAPQCFWLGDILDVHEQAMEQGIMDSIDSCTLMSMFGKELFTVEGPYENLKITTPDDFYSVRAILDAKENAQIYGYEE